MAYRWEASYPAGLSWAAPLPPPKPLERFLEIAARSWPDTIAIDFDDRTMSFEELHAMARRAAAGFRALGVGPGVHVGLCLTNTPHYPVCFFGVLMAGGIVVNFSPLAGAMEIERQLADSRAEILVTLDSARRALDSARSPKALRQLVVCQLDDFTAGAAARPLAPGGPSGLPVSDFTDLIGRAPLHLIPVRGPLTEEVAVIQYTGGTTGASKGAMLTHANFSAAIYLHHRWYLGDQPVGSGRPSEPDKILVVMPMVHIFGLVCVMLFSIVSGRRMILHTRFEPRRVLQDIADKKVGAFVGAPVMFKALADHLQRQEFDLSSLQSCSSGGAPLPLQTASQFSRRAGLPLNEGYGLTELTALGTLHLPARRPRTGSVGLPLPHTVVEVVDLDQGTSVLGANQVGEICFRGPQVMKGYWNSEEETRTALRGGRFHTGDIGFVDEQGFVSLVDRKKDMIITGGFNVFPSQVEEAILEHPDVAEAVVLGLPEPNLGQVGKAYIVGAPGRPPMTYRALRSFLAGRLASYEIPVALEICESLPRTSLGKVSKRDLLDAELARSASHPAAPVAPA